MSRRSFFNRIARAAAIVALAPQIAFRVPNRIAFRNTRCVDLEYVKTYERLMAENPTFTAFIALDLAERKELHRAL